MAPIQNSYANVVDLDSMIIMGNNLVAVVDGQIWNRITDERSSDTVIALAEEHGRPVYLKDQGGTEYIGAYGYQGGVVDLHTGNYADARALYVFTDSKMMAQIDRLMIGGENDTEIAELVRAHGGSLYI